jgi:hypothetical protein
MDEWLGDKNSTGSHRRADILSGGVPLIGIVIIPVTRDSQCFLSQDTIRQQRILLAPEYCLLQKQ